MELWLNIMIVHDGEYIDPIKQQLLDKFPALKADWIRTTDQAYMYQNVKSKPKFSLLVVTKSVDLEKVKKILKQLPYTLPTIVLMDELPTKGPKINELMKAVPDIDAWDPKVS